MLPIPCKWQCVGCSGHVQPWAYFYLFSCIYLLQNSCRIWCEERRWFTDEARLESSNAWGLFSNLNPSLYSLFTFSPCNFSPMFSSTAWLYHNFCHDVINLFRKPHLFAIFTQVLLSWQNTGIATVLEYILRYFATYIPLLVSRWASKSTVFHCMLIYRLFPTILKFSFNFPTRVIAMLALIIRFWI